ncbi:uncharacterized protein [Lolium perenne]|uniref:uncharacterized protein n=1 Tax=Lolium perenne TaxID=4522 RepID=UPI003A992C29
MADRPPTPNSHMFGMSDFGLDPTQYNPYGPPLVDPDGVQSTSTTTTGTKRRKKTSPVWDHFEEEEFEEDGVMKLQSRCKWPGCGKAMSTGGKGGTGHMARHIASHQAKDEQAALIQTRIGFNSDNENLKPHLKKLRIAISFMNSSNGRLSEYQTYCTAWGSGELAKYLNCDIVPHGDSEDFNILQWWNAHKITYPVLSILAKDVLSVPVSTVSSESAFSLAGRILDERRTSLTPDMVRTLMTVKDGELAKRRAQHTTCNEELVAAFEHVGIDDEEE